MSVLPVDEAVPALDDPEATTLIDLNDDILVWILGIFAGARHSAKVRFFRLMPDRVCEMLRLARVCVTFKQLSASFINADVKKQAVALKMQANLMPLLQHFPAALLVSPELLDKMDLVRHLLDTADAAFLEMGGHKLHGGADAIAKRVVKKRLSKVQLVEAYQAHRELVAERVAPAIMLAHLDERGLTHPALAGSLASGLLLSVLRDGKQRVGVCQLGRNGMLQGQMRDRIVYFLVHIRHFQSAAVATDPMLTAASMQHALLDAVFEFCDTLGWPPNLFACIVELIFGASTLFCQEHYRSWRNATVLESNPRIEFCIDEAKGRRWIEAPGNAERAREATLRKLSTVIKEVMPNLRTYSGIFMT